MKKSETQSKLKRIPFYKIWWNRWFGWRGIPLPVVKFNRSIAGRGIPQEVIRIVPMELPTTETLFYLDFEYQHRYKDYLDNAIDNTAQKITSGLI